MSKKTVRRSLSMTLEMHERLALLVSRHPRDVTESDLIREAIRRHLDEQEDLTGSRKHFQRSFRHWKRRLKADADVEPLLLERGIALKISDLDISSLPPAPPEESKHDKLREAYQSAMDRVTEKASATQFTGLNTMRRTYETRKQHMEAETI